MRIIDRYLLRQFISVFFICWCSLTGLYIVFDAFSNLDEFMHYAEKHGSLLGLMGSFYAYRSIYFFDRTSAILAMISAMFTVTWIQRHNELTALMAAGISRRRVVMPVIVAAILVSVLSTANREMVIPRLRSELARNPKDLMGEAAQELRPRYDSTTDILFRGQKTFANEQRISEPSFLLPPSIDAESRQITASDCYFQSANAQHPAGYLFRNVKQPMELLTGTITQAGQSKDRDHPAGRQGLAGPQRMLRRQRSQLRATLWRSGLAAILIDARSGRRAAQS